MENAHVFSTCGETSSEEAFWFVAVSGSVCVAPSLFDERKVPVRSSMNGRGSSVSERSSSASNNFVMRS